MSRYDCLRQVPRTKDQVICQSRCTRPVDHRFFYLVSVLRHLTVFSFMSSNAVVFIIGGFKGLSLYPT